MTESAHLIWKLRNERVIQEDGEQHSQAEVTNRWYKAINNRLHLDCRATNTRKYGHKGTKLNVVKKTWTKLLHQESSLPEDWYKGGGVLVGIRPRDGEG